MVKCVNIWKICRVQKILTFSKWLGLKFILGKKIHSKWNIELFWGDRLQKFTDSVSDSTMQQNFKRILLVKCWCSIKEKQAWLSENASELVFSNKHLCGTWYVCYNKTTYWNRFNAEDLWEFRSFKSGIKEICKNVKQ